MTVEYRVISLEAIYTHDGANRFYLHIFVHTHVTSIIKEAIKLRGDMGSNVGGKEGGSSIILFQLKTFLRIQYGEKQVGFSTYISQNFFASVFVCGMCVWIYGHM